MTTAASGRSPTGSSSAAWGGLRPLPFRGDLIAAGGVALAVGVAVLALRMDDAWAAGPRVLVAALPAALLLALGWRAPVEGPTPRAYVSALLVSAFAPLALALVALAELLGADGSSSGTLAWIAAALVTVYGLLSVGRASAVCALLAATAAVVALVAAVDWLVEPEAIGLRWPLLAAVVALAAGSAALRGRRPVHAHALALAGGLAALSIAVLLLDEGAGIAGASFTRDQAAVAAVAGGADVWSAGWEVLLLAVGAALLALSASHGGRGAGWMGAWVLAGFVALAAPGEATLLWWPLLLLVAGAAGAAAGLATGRGWALAAGGVAGTLGLLVLEARFAADWDDGVLAAILAAGAAAAVGLGWRAPAQPARSLLPASFPLALAALVHVAEALGGSPGAAGTVTWIALVLAAGYGAIAALRRSGALTLLAATSAVVALLAAAQWIFEPETPDGFRWLLLSAIAALTVGTVRLRDRRHGQAVALADAAGLAALALAVLLYGLFVSQLFAFDGAAPAGIGAGWELLLLVVGSGACAFGGVDRANGPAWIGAAVLAAFALLASLGAASVLWWPALLVALGAGVVAAGLRPTTPLPPPPDADAPPAPTTVLEPLRRTTPDDR